MAIFSTLKKGFFAAAALAGVSEGLRMDDKFVKIDEKHKDPQVEHLLLVLTAMKDQCGQHVTATPELFQACGSILDMPNEEAGFLPKDMPQIWAKLDEEQQRDVRNFVNCDLQNMFSHVSQHMDDFKANTKAIATVWAKETERLGTCSDPFGTAYSSADEIATELEKLEL